MGGIARARTIFPSVPSSGLGRNIPEAPLRRTSLDFILHDCPQQYTAPGRLSRRGLLKLAEAELRG